MSNPVPPVDPIRIAVLNDHVSFIQALERFLEDEPDLDVVSIGHASPRSLDPVIEKRPEVAIIDPEMHELEIGLMIHQLCDALPAIRIIVLTMNDDERFREAALAAGAHDFILKLQAAEQLVPAIRRVRSSP